MALALLVSSAEVAAQAGVDWFVVRPAGSGASLRAMAYGGGRYVAVGDEVVVSLDGVVWESHPAPSSGLRSIAYGNDVFVAAASDDTPPDPAGHLFVSRDGADWQDVSLQAPFSPIAVVYDGAAFTAVGYHGLVYRSIDGETWEELPSGFEPFVFRDYTSRGDEAIIVGLNFKPVVGWEWPRLMMSVFHGPLDHLVWERVDYPNWGFLDAVAATSDIAVAAGRYYASPVEPVVATSTDLQAWALADVPVSGAAKDAIVFGGSFYVCGGDGTTSWILSSETGAAWAVEYSTQVAHLHGFADDGVSLVVVGADGIVLKGVDGRLFADDFESGDTSAWSFAPL